MLLALPSTLVGIAAGVRAGVLVGALSAAAICGLVLGFEGKGPWPAEGMAVAAVICAAGVFGGTLGELARRTHTLERRDGRNRKSLHAVVSRAVDLEARERARIAEELHDGVLQSLLVAHQDLSQPGIDPDQLDRARIALLDAIEEMKVTLAGLQPAGSEGSGLERALEATARRAAARGGFEVAVDVEADASGYHDALILSIARALLSNVAEHARAREAAVWVGRSEAGVELTVHDDGRGIGPDETARAVGEGRLGLAMAKERLEAVGGELIISVPPLGGSIVRAMVPLDAALSGEIARLELVLARSGGRFGESGTPQAGG